MSAAKKPGGRPSTPPPASKARPASGSRLKAAKPLPRPSEAPPATPPANDAGHDAADVARLLGAVSALLTSERERTTSKAGRAMLDALGWVGRTAKLYEAAPDMLQLAHFGTKADHPAGACGGLAARLHTPPAVDPLPAMLAELGALTARYNDACEGLAVESEIGVTIMALNVVRKAGLAAVEGKGIATLEAIADMKLAPAAPRLTDPHFNLITATADAFARTGEMHEELMSLLGSTHPKADPPTKDGLHLVATNLLEVMWQLEGELRMISAEVTGLAAACPVAVHAQQLGVLRGYGDRNRATAEVADAIASFTDD